MNSQRDQEELPRMRRLVLKEGRGSKLYRLRLPYQMIGLGGMSSVRALATVLQEELRRDPLCHHFNELSLSGNNLNDEHLAVLAPVFGKCSILELLHLKWSIV